MSDLRCIVTMFRREQQALQRQLGPRVKVIVWGDNVYGFRFTEIDTSRVNTDIMSNAEYERYVKWEQDHLATRLFPVPLEES